MVDLPGPWRFTATVPLPSSAGGMPSRRPWRRPTARPGPLQSTDAGDEGHRCVDTWNVRWLGGGVDMTAWSGAGGEVAHDHRPGEAARGEGGELSIFDRFASAAARAVAGAWFFLLCVVLVVVWAP